MKKRTLVHQRRYFGIEAVALRDAAARVLARVVGLPPDRCYVSERHLRHDFGVDTQDGPALVARLVAGGLIERHAERTDDYAPTTRFGEFASARIVEPLRRDKARRLVSRAVVLAQSINADWSRNPLAVAALATSGAYLTPADQLDELRLGVIVCERPPQLRARWRTLQTDKEGHAEIRHAFEAMSSFVRVAIAANTDRLPRPFCIAWHDERLG